ncbi:unnamed protein product, partial [Allacma fusca]
MTLSLLELDLQD